MAKFLTKKFVLWALVAVAAGGVVSYYTIGNESALNLISVSRGDISDEVIVTGNTKAVHDIDLEFQASGKIAAVYANVGDKVNAGEVLAKLNSSQLEAQLRQAQASVEAAQAKLDALLRGTRAEDIQITKTAIAKAEQDLANNYNGVTAILSDAYAKSNDAVRNQVSALFTSADTISPQLSFSTTDSQTQINAQSERMVVGSELNDWKNELVLLNSTANPAPANLDTAIKNAGSHLAAILKFLNTLMNTLVGSPNLSATTLTTYKTSVTAAESQVSTAITNVNDVGQAIASQKIVVTQNKDQLALELAGSTPEDIRAQQASVDEAKAKTASVLAEIDQTVIHSPINGTVTRNDARVGEIASPNTTLISVISLGDLEIEVNVPEVDIGKVMVGNPVRITLDAFPDETFSGKVAKIDPAETIIDGVVDFRVTIDFDKADARIKSGFTANLEIETQKKTGVLIVPEAAILQNDSGTFVKKYEGGKEIQAPVIVGIRDQNGSVEIVSGVNEGDKLVNIGLKTQ
ncbi:MAG: efflux RND transporter periplasmic adaptor subunit [Candidatus Liptonbacteria bacterium]|nr:efflux RND transporter periplasmic adaptor subunit [Candidatus Liptonbacteria bacterium]